MTRITVNSLWTIVLNLDPKLSHAHLFVPFWVLGMGFWVNVPYLCSFTFLGKMSSLSMFHMPLGPTLCWFQKRFSRCRETSSLYTCLLY